MKIEAASRLSASESAGRKCERHLDATVAKFKPLHLVWHGVGLEQGASFMAAQYPAVSKILADSGYKPSKISFPNKAGKPYSDRMRFDNGTDDFVGFFFITPPEDDRPGHIRTDRVRMSKK